MHQYFGILRANEKTLESATVITILLLLFILHLSVALQLDNLKAFDQYNIFFDADPNQYKSAFSNGWGFGESIHPAIALFINVPVRAVDYAVAKIGLLPLGFIRSSTPLIVAPLFSMIGGVFWWLSACLAQLSVGARLAGLLIFQFAFSQMVFSKVPESYAISGGLISILLFLCVSADRDPSSLDSKRVKFQWLAIAIIMSGVTITNGFMCIFVWAAIRLRKIPLRHLILEVSLATVVITGAIATFGATDNLVYQREKNKIEDKANETLGFAQKYLNSSLPSRAIAMPADFLSSILSPPVDEIPNELADPEHDFQYGFSIKNTSKSTSRIIIGWLIFGVTILVVILNSSFSIIHKSIVSVILYNWILHSIFGSETFLYSQHWLAFLAFAVAISVSGRLTLARLVAMLCLISFVVATNIDSWIKIQTSLEETHDLAMKSKVKPAGHW